MMVMMRALQGADGKTQSERLLVIFEPLEDYRLQLVRRRFTYK